MISCKRPEHANMTTQLRPSTCCGSVGDRRPRRACALYLFGVHAVGTRPGRTATSTSSSTTPKASPCSISSRSRRTIDQILGARRHHDPWRPRIRCCATTSCATPSASSDEQRLSSRRMSVICIDDHRSSSIARPLEGGRRGIESSRGNVLRTSKSVIRLPMRTSPGIVAAMLARIGIADAGASRTTAQLER